MNGINIKDNNIYMVKTQAEINKIKIDELYLVINSLEEKVDIINATLINNLEILEKLVDSMKDMELNIKHLYIKSRQDDIKTEPIKTGWFV